MSVTVIDPWYPQGGATNSLAIGGDAFVDLR